MVWMNQETVPQPISQELLNVSMSPDTLLLAGHSDLSCNDANIVTKDSLISYSFDVVSTSVLPGTSHSNKKPSSADKIGDMAILIDPYGSSSYFTDGRYNKMDYKVEQGSVVGTDGEEYEAYQVYPASSEPS